MSSVKIRNFEMPEACFFCVLMQPTGDGWYKCPLAGFKYRAADYYGYAAEHRNPLCPLEPLPDEAAGGTDCPWR